MAIFCSLSIYLRLVELNRNTNIVLLTRHATVDQTHNKYSWINFAIQCIVVDTFLFEFVFVFCVQSDGYDKANKNVATQQIVQKW